MGRSKRICRPGLIYHVINRGNNRQAIFLEREDFYHYLSIVKRYKEKFHFKLFAFCLMTNHVHLLMKVSEAGTISRIMQAITLAHTRQYNYKYRQSGHVWQGRFQSPLVSEDEHLLTVMQYIEQNPVRAKMVRGIADYRFSSFRLNCRKKDNALIDRQENKVFEELGRTLEERIRVYQRLNAKVLEEKKVQTLHKAFGTDGYFSEKFKEQLKQLLPCKRPRGRPRKNLAVSLLK